MDKFYVYILHSKSSFKFYVGQTNAIYRRLKEHNSGESAFTKSGRPWRLIWVTQKKSRRLSEELEQKLKNLTARRKLKFIDKYHSDIVDKNYLIEIKAYYNNH